MNEMGTFVKIHIEFVNDFTEQIRRQQLSKFRFSSVNILLYSIYDLLSLYNEFLYQLVEN